MSRFRRSRLPSIRSKLITLILASVLPILPGYIAFVRDAGEREARHVARDAAAITRALSAALDRDSRAVSMGIASLVPERSDTSASLIRAADALLYQAKADGRNRYCVAQAARRQA